MSEPTPDQRDAERVDQLREVGAKAELQELEAGIKFTLSPDRLVSLMSIFESASPHLAQRHVYLLAVSVFSRI